MLQLPPELILQSLTYLRLPDLGALQATCRAFQALFEENADYIYKNAAVLHDLVPSSATALPDVHSMYPERSLIGVSNWQSFCRRRILIDSGWKNCGLGTSSFKEYNATGDAVHRIKVDEQSAIIIVTAKNGGLRVVDMENGKVIWSLPETYVHRYAHCEYDKGLLVFDRRDRSNPRKEIWQLNSTPSLTAGPVSPSSSPDLQQSIASFRAAESQRSVHNLSKRGHFHPYALLHLSEPTFASRFVFPTLVALSETTAYLWDVPTGTLTQTIDDIGEPSADITYVEVSERHVFVASEASLRVIERASGNTVLRIPSLCAVYGDNILSLKPSSPHKKAETVLITHGTNTHTVTADSPRMVDDQFVGVHVSPCGSHLVALLNTSRVLLIPHFHRILTGERTYQEITTDLQLGSRSAMSMYLAFDGRRVGVATTAGIFIVHHAFDADVGLACSSSTQVSRLTDVSPSWLERVTCLQMSDTGLHFNRSSTNVPTPFTPMPGSVYVDDEEEEEDGEEQGDPDDEFNASIQSPLDIGTHFIAIPSDTTSNPPLEWQAHTVVNDHPHRRLQRPVSSTVWSVNFLPAIEPAIIHNKDQFS